MPILKHAKKKLRQDKKRTIKNRKVKEVLKKLVKAARADKKPESISQAFSALDKAAKKHLLAKNKVARVKSALAKNVTSDKVATTTPKKTATKKKPAKSSKSTKKK